MASHILLEHGLDVPAGLRIARKDGLATEKTTLLSAVPVELDGVGVVALHNVLGLKKDAECLEDGDGAATIVIGARGSENAREPQVDRILMGADHNGRVRLTRDGCDDAVLAPGVLEVLSSDMLLGAGILDDAANLVQQPLARLSPILRLCLENASVNALVC